MRIATLRNAPVPVHIHSDKQTDHVSTNLGKDTSTQTIRVADLAGKLYIIDGHMLVEAHRRRGDTSVDVKVHNANNLKDVIALHVRHNMNNPPNLVQIIQIVLYMRKSGNTDKEIIKSLHLNKLVARLLRLDIDEQAVKELENILRELSTMYYSAHHFFPQGLIEWIFKQSKEKQRSATLALRKSINDINDIPERKFSWPAPMEVRMMQDHGELKSQTPKAVSLFDDNEGMRGRPRNTIVGSTVIKNPPTKAEVSKVGIDSTPSSKMPIVFKCPHDSLLYMDGKSRVFYVDDKLDNTIVRLGHIESDQNIYRISEEYSEFMGVKNGKIYLEKCTPDQALQLLKKLSKKKINVCIMSSEEL